MKIRCVSEDCSKEEEYRSRSKAAKDGWIFNDFAIDGNLYRYGLCEEHKQTEEIPEFDVIYDYTDRQEIEKMKEELVLVKKVTRPQNSSYQSEK